MTTAILAQMTPVPSGVMVAATVLTFVFIFGLGMVFRAKFRKDWGQLEKKDGAKDKEER